MKKYKSYVFRDQDPVVADVLRLIGERDRETSEDSGVSTSCLRAWRSKKTKRPQHATLAAAAGAAGMEFRLVKRNGKL